MKATIAACVLGALLISAGTAMIYLPAGVIAAGVLTVAAGVALVPVGGGRK